MPSNITFATDGRNLNSKFYPVLNSVVLVINEYNKTTVMVSGHTDSTGSNAYNQRLSQDRASSVADYFVNKKVVPARLDVAGFGEKYPIATNKSKQGRSLNRRVEITLLPITENPG